MLNRRAYLFVSLLLALSWPARAQSLTARYPAALLDSLRQLGHWPEATQLRLLRRRATVDGGPVVELWRWPRRLAPQPQLALYEYLADYYFLLQQPSVAVLRAQEGRTLALAQHDSTGRSVMATLLSFGYTLLGQPRRARDYGWEAVRVASGKRKYNLLDRGYHMLSMAAHDLSDHALDFYCGQQALHMARRAHHRVNEAISMQNMANISISMQRYDLAARYLDSARTINQILPPELRVGMPLLEAQVLLGTGHPRQARRQLLASLAECRRTHDPDHEQELLPTLIQVQQQLGNYASALAYQQRLTSLSEAASQATIKRQAQELQTIYQTQAREREQVQEQRRLATIQALDRQHALAARRQYILLTIATLLGGVGLLYASYRRRLARAQREEALRTRIATDLHDEVGTLLARVSLQADMLSYSQASPPAELARLQTNARAAAGTMRDIVWGIDAQADTAGALLDRMGDYLYQLSTPAGLATELRSHGLAESQALPADCRQHLYLIFKEAVTNAVRHAPGATQLTVTLAQQGGELALTVENDGPLSAAGGGRSGMGLRNMRQRAAALRGQLQAGPLPAGGYRVHLVLPCR